MGTAPVAAAAVASPSATDRRTDLVHPVLDFLGAGALSILVMVGIHVWLPLQGETQALATNQVSHLFYWLGFVVNWPHFLITYQILYWNNRDQLLKRPRFIWAGVVAPFLMLGGLTLAALMQSQYWMGLLVQTMFLLVGWHFVKQSYGVAVVLAAKSGWFLKPAERRVARSAMYALWALNFAGTQVGTQGYNYNGIFYGSLELPQWTLAAGYAGVAVTGVALVAMVARKARVEGRTPPLNAMVSILAIYVWFIPAASHPTFFYMIPFFHALQYMLFAVTLNVRRGEARYPEGGLSRWIPIGVYLGLTVVLGAFFSTLLPNWLDGALHYDGAVYGPTFWLFAFTWFINLHHYLIDNRIWLSDSPGVKQYL